MDAPQAGIMADMAAISKKRPNPFIIMPSASPSFFLIISHEVCHPSPHKKVKRLGSAADIYDIIRMKREEK
jgi:predicted SprT family Zn-dependent metalloprotease